MLHAHRQLLQVVDARGHPRCTQAQRTRPNDFSGPDLWLSAQQGALLTVLLQP